MRVIVFQCVSPRSPAAYIARIRCDMPTKGGKVAEDWHPVLFHGETFEDVHAKALGWWTDEVAKERQRAENAQARVAARQAAKAQP